MEKKYNKENNKTKFMKNKGLLCVFLWLFLFIFNKQIFASSSPFLLDADIFLNFQKNFIKGNIKISLQPNKNYEIFVKDFIIKKVFIGTKELKSLIYSQNGNLLILSGSKSRILKIEFEKKVNFDAYPIGIYHPFFPYLVNHAFVCNLRVYVPKKQRKYYILVPYKKFKLKRTKYYSVYVFKTHKLTLPPPLIVGNLIRKKINIENLTFSFYCLKNERKFCYSINPENFLKEIKNFKNYPLNFSRFFIFISKDFYEPYFLPQFITLSEKEIKSKEILKKFYKNSFLYGVYWEDINFGKALSFFLLSYLPSNQKETLRKKLLIKDTKITQYAFFLITFLKEEIHNIFNATKQFYDKHAFQKVNYTEYLQYFFEKNIPNIENFYKAKLDFQKNFLVKTQDKYLFSYTIKSSCPVFSPLEVKIVTENKTISQKFFLKNKTSFQSEIFLDSPPKKVILDSEYLIYRNLSFEEIEPTLENVLNNPGIVVVNKNNVLKYGRLLKLLKNHNFSIYYVDKKNLRDLEKFIYSQKNVIFLEIFPKEIFFLKVPKEGFYFYVIPYYNSLKVFLMYSKFNNNKIEDLFLKNLKYTEIWINNGKILTQRVIKKENGLVFNVSTNFSIVKSINLPSSQALAEELLSIQVVILNFPKTKEQLTIFKEVLEYLKNFYDIAIFFDEINTKNFQNFLKWAAEKEIFIKKIEIPLNLIEKIETSGLKNLSKEDLLTLPEIDFYNPPLENYLKKVFLNNFNSSSTYGNPTSNFTQRIFNNGTLKLSNLSFDNFDNYYRAELTMLYFYVENISNYLHNSPNKQIFFITKDKDLIKKLEISRILQKKGVKKFSILKFLDYKIEVIKKIDLE